MLVTNVGGLPEIVPHNVVGYIAEPDAHEIANYIHAFYTDNKKEEFVQNIVNEKNKYTWKAMTDKVFEVVKLKP